MNNSSIGRRSFLQATLAGAAGGTAWSNRQSRAAPGADGFDEPSRRLPLVEDADVIVCGAGPAGIAAALAAAIVFTGVAQWCSGRAALATARAIEDGQAGRAAASPTVQGYLQTGHAFAIAGIVAAIIGCVAWWLSVKKKQAGTPLLPISLLAVYLLLSLLMV